MPTGNVEVHAQSSRAEWVPLSFEAAAANNASARKPAATRLGAYLGFTTYFPPYCNSRLSALNYVSRSTHRVIAAFDKLVRLAVRTQPQRVVRHELVRREAVVQFHDADVVAACAGLLEDGVREAARHPEAYKGHRAHAVERARVVCAHRLRGNLDRLVLELVRAHEGLGGDDAARRAVRCLVWSALAGISGREATDRTAHELRALLRHVGSLEDLHLRIGAESWP